jgi:molecular chaperone DnaJ
MCDQYNFRSNASTCPYLWWFWSNKKPANADAQGMILEDETVSIKIPAGVVDGMQLKFRIKETMRQESVPGDLIVSY